MEVHLAREMGRRGDQMSAFELKGCVKWMGQGEAPEGTFVPSIADIG